MKSAFRQSQDQIDQHITPGQLVMTGVCIAVLSALSYLLIHI